MNAIANINGGNELLSLDANEERLVKKRRIQSQLMMLLHALDCVNGSCTTAKCDQFKALWTHLRGCGGGEVECHHPFCKSSKLILSHWEKCRSRTCPVCCPVEVVTGTRRGVEQPPPPQPEAIEEQTPQDPGSSLQVEHPQTPDQHSERHNLQSFPTTPSGIGSANQAPSRFGPIRVRHRQGHAPSPKAAIQRVLHSRGIILSESKIGDLDVKIDVEDDDVDIDGSQGSINRSTGSGINDSTRSGINRSTRSGINDSNPIFEGIDKKLEKELEFHKRRSECPVCWENLKAVALQCGHQCCHRCAQSLDKCHSCRSEILLKIKLY